MKTPRGNSESPRTKKKGRAGLMVTGIVLAIVLVTFVGYNISHLKVMEREEKSGNKEYTGLN